MIITQEQIDAFRAQHGIDPVCGISGTPIRAGDDVEVQEIPAEGENDAYQRVVLVQHTEAGQKLANPEQEPVLPEDGEARG